MEELPDFQRDMHGFPCPGPVVRYYRLKMMYTDGVTMSPRYLYLMHESFLQRIVKSVRHVYRVRIAQAEGKEVVKENGPRHLKILYKPIKHVSI